MNLGQLAEGGRRAATTRRRRIFDRLVAEGLGAPVTPRDVEVFRIAWRLALQAMRQRQSFKGAARLTNGIAQPYSAGRAARRGGEG